jgi:L-rhamnose isomerase
VLLSVGSLSSQGDSNYCDTAICQAIIMQYRLFMTANEILGDTTDIWELFLVSESCYTMFDQPKNAKVS